MPKLIIAVSGSTWFTEQHQVDGLVDLLDAHADGNDTYVFTGHRKGAEQVARAWAEARGYQMRTFDGAKDVGKRNRHIRVEMGKLRSTARLVFLNVRCQKNRGSSFKHAAAFGIEESDVVIPPKNWWVHGKREKTGEQRGDRLG